MSKSNQFLHSWACNDPISLHMYNIYVYSYTVQSAWAIGSVQYDPQNLYYHHNRLEQILAST